MKKELEIKRHIRLKASSDIVSPTLVEVLFPTVYIPCLSIPDYNMHLVLLHELTHYKRNVIEQIGSKKHHKISTFKAVLSKVISKLQTAPKMTPICSIYSCIP